MSSVFQYFIEGFTKPFGLFGRYGVIAGMVVSAMVFLNYLLQYISIRRVSLLLLTKRELMA